MPAFYLDQPAQNLRFGDVVTGFQHPAIRINAPDSTAKALDLEIRITRPQYFAVMTPCCSIELKSISLAPLIEVRDSFLKFPRFLEDLSRINVRMLAREAFTPEQLDKMELENKLDLLAREASYFHYDCFIYEPNGLFPVYEVKRNRQTWPDIRHRMVDFKSIFRVECSQIEREQDAPNGIKVSELTVTTRAQLRDKLTAYFGRNADAAVA